MARGARAPLPCPSRRRAARAWTPPWHARARDPRRRARARRLGRRLRQRTHRARNPLPAARRVGVDGRRRIVAAHEVRARHVARGARARRRMYRAMTPAPLAQMPVETRRAIRVVLTDIDDTLTTEGKLTADAYAALARLHDAGLIVVPVTGRPAGWCDHIARMWPVDAVVGENGAFYMRFDSSQRKLVRRFAATDAERASIRERLAAVGASIIERVPGSALASDQHYRETDVAIDYCEDVKPLDAAVVARIVELMQAEGMTAKVSSIHVNGWFGDYDKLAMTRVLFAEVFSQRLDDVRDVVLFAGDSPNDAPMFGYFPCSVGVANLARFLAQLAAKPAYMTKASAGAGFTEIADFLLD